jgi:hypothetical protein
MFKVVKTEDEKFFDYEKSIASLTVELRLHKDIQTDRQTYRQTDRIVKPKYPQFCKLGVITETFENSKNANNLKFPVPFCYEPQLGKY